MKILVLGNGFDLAHSLPTKYSHFLDFVRLFRDYGQYITKEKTIPEGNERIKNCFAFIQKIYQPNGSGDDLYREICSYTADNNLLLNHFLKTYQNRCKLGREGWIDFEAEIADIVRLFDEARNISIQQREEGKKCILPDNIAQRITPFILYERTDIGITIDMRGKILSPDFIEEQGKRIHAELTMIIRLFEIYLLEIVSKQEIQKEIGQISELQIDKVLSFNYTKTYMKAYDPNETAEYCYIHGKIDDNSNLQDCNLVLGINEYLDNDRQNQDNAFVWFKKFYQRIAKETSSTYIDWLDDHTLSNQRTPKLPPTPLDIYFYGHSLDVSDRDVLRRLILHKNARIHIFYPEKKEMGKQINNLIKVIDAENLIQMTRGRNRTIEFIQITNN